MTNLVFLIYLVFLQPGVLQRLAWVVDRSRRDGPLAAALLLALVLESVGLWLKSPGMLARLDRMGAKKSSVLNWLAWIGHALMTVVLAMMAASALGFDIAEADDGLTGGIGMGVGILLVLKELWVLFVVFLPLGQERSEGTGQPEASAEERSLALREALGDLLILPYTTLGFTFLWDFTAMRTPIDWSSPLAGLVELSAAVLLFSIALFASRGIYLVEEFSVPRSLKANVLMWGIYAANLVAALTILPIKDY